MEIPDLLQLAISVNAEDARLTRSTGSTSSSDPCVAAVPVPLHSSTSKARPNISWVDCRCLTRATLILAVDKTLHE